MSNPPALNNLELQQEQLDPARRASPPVPREIRLQETIKRSVSSIDYVLDREKGVDAERPWLIIGMLSEALAAVRDDLEAAL